MRVVYFGTPAFAVPSLRALVAEGIEVLGVVTQPDRPQGRSRSVLIPPPVKEAATELGCDAAQGFLFSEPLTGTQFMDSKRHARAPLALLRHAVRRGRVAARPARPAGRAAGPRCGQNPDCIVRFLAVP